MDSLLLFDLLFGARKKYHGTVIVASRCTYPRNPVRYGRMNICGTVVHGKKEAGGLGYPTANIVYTSSERAASGVWTSWLDVDGERYESLAVVGMWQLETGAPSLEVHALNTDLDMYGKNVTVTLGALLRPLQQFRDTALLVKQIQEDVVMARAWFASR